MIMKIFFFLLVIESSLSAVEMTFDINNPSPSTFGSHGYFRFYFEKEENQPIEKWFTYIDFSADVKIVNEEQQDTKHLHIELQRAPAQSGNLMQTMRKLAKIKQSQDTGENVNLTRPPSKAVIILSVSLGGENGAYIPIESDEFSLGFDETKYEEAWSNGALNQSKAGPTLLTKDTEDQWAEFMRLYSPKPQWGNGRDYKNKADQFLQDFNASLDTIFEHPSKAESITHSVRADELTYNVAEFAESNVNNIVRVGRERIVILIKAFMNYKGRILI